MAWQRRARATESWFSTTMRRSAGAADSCSASHASVASSTSWRRPPARVERVADVLRGRVVHARPDVLDLGEVLVEVRLEDLVLADLVEADHDLVERAVRGVRPVHGEIPGLGLRGRGRAGGAGVRGVLPAGDRVVAGRARRRSPRRRARRVRRGGARRSTAGRCRRRGPREGQFRRATRAAARGASPSRAALAYARTSASCSSLAGGAFCTSSWSPSAQR